MIDHIDYDGFGNVRSETNPAVTHLIGYTGRPFDAETGLQNNHRWYDANTGRWISKDPIGFAAGDANLSRYVGNGPVNASDPSGLIIYDDWPGKKGPLYTLPSPRRTTDQQTVLDMAKGDADLLRSLENLFRALDELRSLTPLDWWEFNGYCHAWTNLLIGEDGALKKNGRFDDTRFAGLNFKYRIPKYDGLMPFWRDHGVIEVQLSNGEVFWLDRYAYGGRDHIFTQWPKTLCHPNQTRFPQPPRNNKIYNPYEHNWPRSY